MNSSDISQMLSAMARPGNDGGPRRLNLAPDVEAIRLREAFAAYTTAHVFAPGDIVRQKPQARFYEVPSANGFMVILGFVEVPRREERTNEIMDIVAGCLDEDEDFAVCVFPSIRLEPVPPEEITLATKSAT